MENHFQLNDLQFESQFENGTFDPKLFSHEAHIRLAWIHIKNYGIEKAIENVDGQLLKYATSLGAGDKYNKTVTVAAVRAVYHFFLKSKSENFKDFIVEFPRLKNNFKELLDSHYGFDIFKLQTAKKEYLDPDLLPFD
jgi:hypothetical protein